MSAIYFNQKLPEIAFILLQNCYRVIVLIIAFILWGKKSSAVTRQCACPHEHDIIH
jgi:hypothetical protein